jgi:hypothetical protein
MRALRNYLRRSATERRLALRALVTTAAVRLGLTVFPLATVRRWAVGGTRMGPGDRVGGGRAPTPEPSDVPSVENIAWAVRAASRFVPKASCLTQALVVERFMRRAGYAPHLHIGVARPGQTAFEAHAWVEHDGRIVIGEVDEMDRFTILPPLPDQG